MSLRLVQLRSPDGSRCVVAIGPEGIGRRVGGLNSTYELAQAALRHRTTLAEVAQASVTAESIDVAAALEQHRVLAPIDHIDPAHLYLSGTGLTHLGSAESRDKMHQGAARGAITDSMRMFNLGIEGGKPVGSSVGVQPEWFYKGDGSNLCAPEMPLRSPAFALDGSEEPEIAGIYLIDPDGVPRRLGYCLANEFSDHITERHNYLWLAHSKLRPAALGPELLTGELPRDIRGTSRVLREAKTIWEKAFLTGEANMSHSLVNLEAHHFKYALFRRPGDVHVHFFGTATLSFADGVQTRVGDVFEIEAPPFRFALRNRLEGAPQPSVCIRTL
jgi:hypothetical protein